MNAVKRYNIKVLGRTFSLEKRCCWMTSSSSTHFLFLFSFFFPACTELHEQETLLTHIKDGSLSILPTLFFFTCLTWIHFPSICPSIPFPPERSTLGEKGSRYTRRTVKTPEVCGLPPHKKRKTKWGGAADDSLR